jgi:hypothetical protein
LINHQEKYEKKYGKAVFAAVQEGHYIRTGKWETDKF